VPGYSTGSHFPFVLRYFFHCSVHFCGCGTVFRGKQVRKIQKKPRFWEPSSFLWAPFLMLEKK